MNIKQSLIDAWEISKLNTIVMQKTAKEKTIIASIVIVLIAGLASGIGTLQLDLMILSPVYTLVGSFITIGITHLVAKLFRGQASFQEYYNVRAHGYLISVLLIIPFISNFLVLGLWVWSVVINYFTIRTIHKLDPIRSVLTILIPMIVVGLVILIFFSATLFALLEAGSI